MATLPTIRRATLAVLLTLGVAGGSPAKDIIVGAGGTTGSVRQALEEARDGDRIIVREGVYREGTIAVTKSVHIIGVGDPVFDGEGEHQVFTITADGVTISGLVIRNVGVSFIEDRAGIKLDDVRDCVIEGNRLIDTFFGIYLARSADCRITDNEITGSGLRESQSGNGIHLWYSKNITVEGNRISGHRDGIYFEFVEDGLIRDNTSEGNVRYGLHFMFSDRCRYLDNRFRRNGAGVAVMYTERVEMVNNVFEANWGGSSYGLLLKDITDSHITGNTFVRNSTALYAEGINRVRVERNDFIDNGWAVRIMANSMENTFSRNNFVGNTFDVSTNSRNNFSVFEANFWDQYSGYDLDRNGFGDIPYRPVRLFSTIVEQNEPALMLLRSFFVDVLDMAERMIPIMTPNTLVDSKPIMRRIQ